MKYLVMPNNKENISNILNTDVEGIILPLQDMSVYFDFEMNLDEIKEIISEKKIFISMNKIMHNDDIEKSKSLLEEINNMNIEGVFISDIGLFNLIKRDYPNINIVIDQTHLITNYKTCNYWLSKGAKCVSLSVELMKDELNEISSNTNILTICHVFGYIPMFNSPRHLLTNYFEYIKEEKDKDKYYLIDEKADTKYLIHEGKETVVYSDNVVNAIREKDTINCDYGIINGYMIDDIEAIIDSFINVGDYKEMKKNISNMDTGYLYKECIYKVRDHE